MLNEKKQLPSYPSGVLGVYKAKPRKTDFGARRNIEKRSDMEFIGSVCYNVQTIRDQDFAFAERASFKLSLKVKCPRFDLVTPDCYVLIGETLFDISHLDKTKDEMYLYMEEVGEIDID